ncbi:hypothetical protein BDN72DRAFT_865518 [Pluteus cervinus]|uniref:Uncharacterized protein n=1 Tax=Pluteus cervinus TaxID=181527 RepID=A0ACD2ZZH0_9AGAR|nr:hypothetical protein BDN72DRAFT_865518 [Pluteus cervinus]
MPRRCFTKEQQGVLHTKLPGFIDAQGRGRGKAYVRAIHAEFSKRWPEQEELFPGRRKINCGEELAVQALKEKREGRNSGKRGRLTGRAIQQLVRKHKNKRKRTLQSGEIYSQLYAEKVSAVYQERKTPNLSRGARLNLRRKIATELLEGESEEVKEEVEAEREKNKDGLHAEQDVDGDLDAATDDPKAAAQEYIDDLPAMLSSIIDEVGTLCPDWGFQLVAAGPMPKADNRFRVFDIYSGPKSLEGNTFSESHDGFSKSFCAPLCQKEEREKVLSALKYTITPEGSDSEDDNADQGGVSSFKSPSAPPTRRTRTPSFTGSENDKRTSPPRRAPPLLINPNAEDDDDEHSRPSSPRKSGQSGAKAAQKSRRTALDHFPISESDSSDSDFCQRDEAGPTNDDDNGTISSKRVDLGEGGEDKEDQDENQQGSDRDEDKDKDQPKSTSTKRPRRVAFEGESDSDAPNPVTSSDRHAKKRAAATAKRLETREKRRLEKEVEAAKKKEAEAAKKEVEETRQKKASADEARAKRVEAEKAAKVKTPKKKATTGGNVVEVVETNSAGTKALSGNGTKSKSKVPPQASPAPRDDQDDTVVNPPSRTNPARTNKTAASGSRRKAKPTSNDVPAPSPDASASAAVPVASIPLHRGDASPTPPPQPKRKSVASSKRPRDEPEAPSEETSGRAKRVRKAPTARDADVSFAPPPRVKRT